MNRQSDNANSDNTYLPFNTLSTINSKIYIFYIQCYPSISYTWHCTKNHCLFIITFTCNGKSS